MNYNKWDQIVDSDEETENRQRHYKSEELEAAEKRAELKDEIDNWLRWQISKLGRNAADPTTDQLYASMPELAAKRKKPIMPRQVTKEEREVLSMLIAVSHFEEGDTNLGRHPQMLDMVRHHRWLEEDPGTLELICRLHNNVMKEGGADGSGGGGRRKFEDPEATRMRNMLLSTVNTLAAPRRAKCSSGLLELFNTICTPTTEDGRDLRKKWQTKEFAKDALFDSLFPDLRQFTEDQTDEGYGSDFWIIVALAVLAILGIIGFMVLYSYGVMSPPSHSRVTSSAKNMSNDTLFATAGSASANGDLPTETRSAPPMASAPAPPPVPAANLAACTDSNDGCEYWARTGECVSNAEFMLANCRMSCSVCQVTAAAGAPRAAPMSSSPGASPNAGDARGQEL